MIFGLAFGALIAQEKNARFTVEVSTDSILFGNYFKVIFSLENANGENFEAPDLSEFRVVSGPNVSSSYSIVNGDVSQRIAYTYYLEPLDLGNYYIQPASIKAGDQIMETFPLEVMVVPNPDGIKQGADKFGMDKNKHPFFDMDENSFFEEFNRISPFMEPQAPTEPPVKKRKKRKTTKL
ncbi:MAG: hypothetical protein DHS20C18_20990 [Saprospiraceae bacterium]|nr:MAG: hypothetical protein DHS20C18_20990 [Saprospiraceae bacterium]